MMNDEPASGLRARRLIPLVIIVVVAIVGFFTLRDILTFDALRENSERLTTWRDSNFALAALGYVLVYAVVVAFSLPGGAVMTLAGGFIFGIVVGAPLTVVAATLGRNRDISCGKDRIGRRASCQDAEKGGRSGDHEQDRGRVAQE